MCCKYEFEIIILTKNNKDIISFLYTSGGSN